ncbi:MAG: DUF1553 domain-containing protein, partial [Planctomycetaceae bacterium]|nr:DUF1553 domain-containing protein [Planctomycetaceae bacterium]
SIVRSGECSVEIWLTPENLQQKGPARIVSLSSDPSHRNLTVGQNGDTFEVRLRTTGTSENGLPSFATASGTVTTTRTHLVVTRSRNGQVRIFLNGKVAYSGRVEGELSNWDLNYPLVVANEATGDRPWIGTIHLMALFDRAISGSEVQSNFEAGVIAGRELMTRLPVPAKQAVSFVQDVRPILQKHCFECHAAGNEEGGLNLSMRSRAMEGGRNGASMRRGHSALSPLIHRVARLSEATAMPPEGSLTPEEIGVLRRWIDDGAIWPESADIADPRIEKAREHWAFQPLASTVPIPQLSKDQTPSGNPIDAFVMAALSRKELALNPPAPDDVLVRRMAMDVVGLPPTPEMHKVYADDPGSLVEHLLADSGYGERWGRHWLDAARYADSDGQEGDRDRPGAWVYRDFVIRAMNDDMPFDQFVRWQLAGDELSPENVLAVSATGFLAAGPSTVLEDSFLEEERLQNRYNELDDIVSTTGSALLGLTIGCARCHDHKYDAVSSREYYRLLSAFHSGDRREVKLAGLSDQAMIFQDFGAEPRTTWLFERGDFYDRDQIVQLGFLNVLTNQTTPEAYMETALQTASKPDSTRQRTALAWWMTDSQRGAGALLARVIVNRLWYHHFGEGLVRSVGDFGVRGELPSHPELLEWLASELVNHGWSLKHIHRLILNSRTWQQSSEFRENASTVDPENQLLWRFTPRRLEAEVLRDSMLSVAGLLNRQMYGPSFKPPISTDAMIARNLKTAYPKDVEESDDTRRRTVYMFHKRVIPYPLLQAFDRPDSLQSCSRRSVTTVAPQALAILNDPFVRDCAKNFARRIASEFPDSNSGERTSDRVRACIESALSRTATLGEVEQGVAFVRSQVNFRQDRGGNEPVDVVSLADFCQVLFGLNEFAWIE